MLQELENNKFLKKKQIREVFTLKLRKKILLMVTSLLLLLGISTFVIVYVNVDNIIINNLNSSLNSYIKLSHDLLEERYPGDWSVEGDKLYKGSKLINGDSVFVDEIKAATNCPTTIFLGDTRISTNVLRDGDRALGTKASPEVVEVVLKQGEEFLGEVDVAGTLHQSKYIPIKDGKGQVVGMFFLGVEKERISSQVNNFMLIIIAITFIALILAVFIAVILTKPITKNVRTILDSLERISAGDLSQPCKVNASDETGRISDHLNKMRENIGELINEIKEDSLILEKNSENLAAISQEISSSSTEVSKAIQEVAVGASSQAGSLVEITETLNNFGHEIEDVVASVKNIDANTKAISSKSDSSNKELEYLIDSINNIRTTFNSFMDKLLVLDNDIGKITEITNLINSVAEQTNLLSLNAAIEASRAGEAGRGFSVVADEIRKLAEQTKSSSEEINNLIIDIGKENSALMNSSRDVQREIERQDTVANTTISSFREIIESLQEIAPLIYSINNLVANISQEKDSILEKVASLSSVSEEVSASSEEISASSEEMSASTEEVTATAQNLNAITYKMTEKVNKFKLQ